MLYNDQWRIFYIQSIIYNFYYKFFVKLVENLNYIHRVSRMSYFE